MKIGEKKNAKTFSGRFQWGLKFVFRQQSKHVFGRFSYVIDLAIEILPFGRDF